MSNQIIRTHLARSVMPPFSGPFRRNKGALCIYSLLILLTLPGCTQEETGLSSVNPETIGLPCGLDSPCPDPEATCLEDFPDGYCTAPCNENLSCPGDHHCITRDDNSSVCAQNCLSDESCREGYFCAQHTINGTDVALCDVINTEGDPSDNGPDETIDWDPENYNFGSPCLSSAECFAPEPLSPTCLSGFDGGYCSTSCSVSSDSCGPDARCINTSNGGACILKCDENPQLCREGYGCCEVDTDLLCLPPETIEGCEPIEVIELGDLGDPCTVDADCGAGEDPGCFLDINGGYCTSWDCRSDADCGEGGLCLISFTSLCLKACTESGDCQTDQVCCHVSDQQEACVAESFCSE